MLPTMHKQNVHYIEMGRYIKYIAISEIQVSINDLTIYIMYRNVHIG